MGARREVLSAVAERYRSAGRSGEGAHPRRAVRDDGLASQACGAGAWATRYAEGGWGRGTDLAQAHVRCDDQGRADGAVGGVGSGVRQAARGDDPDSCCRRLSGTADCSSASPIETRVLAISAATIDRMLGDVKVAAAGGRRRRVGLLLGDPSRGADPDVQRLEEPAARLLRDRHGGARRHIGGGLVHPDPDDGGRCHRLDRVPAACQRATAASSSRRSSVHRACSLGCCAVSTSTTTAPS